MNRRGVAAIGSVIVLSVASPAFGADGTGKLQTDGSGGAHLEVEISDSAQGEGFEPSARIASGRPFVYEWVPHSSAGNGLQHLCNAAGAPFDPVAGPVPWGWLYTVYKRDRSTGQLIGEPELVCVPLTDPAAGPPAPPSLPQPPTIREIWDAAALPAPQIGVSPSADGVTGLETWMWAANARSDVAIAVTLDGFTVTGTAHLVGYEFDFGDGPSVETTGAGSETAPAARHTYETKGEYELGVAALWRGEFVMTGPAITDPIPVDLRTAQLTSRRDYRVVEVRSVLAR